MFIYIPLVIWPEAVLQEFTTIVYMLVSSEVLVSSPSFIVLDLLVSDIDTLSEAGYCCFARTTLFTATFTLIIVVC